MQRKKLLIVGGGNLCLQILQILAPRNAYHFHVASRSLEQATRLCNLVRLGALQMDVDVVIHPWEMNLTERHIEQNAETLLRIRPDIVVNCASLQPWRVITQLPKDRFEALDKAQFGPWLPMHLAPAYALMRAVRQSGVKCLIVNAAYPDAVNTVLDKVGLAPHIGVGSIASLVPATRSAIARLALCTPDQVKVKLIGQHYVGHYVPRAGLPPEANFRLCYWIDGREHTDLFSPQAIFDSVARDFRRLGGVDGQFLTAAAAVTVIDHLFSTTEVEVHAPGPHGLPGGYPVRLGMGNVLLSLPYAITREDAINTNRRGQHQDGIAVIHADGEVSFGIEQMAVMEAELGFFMPRMRVNEAAQWAQELGEKYRVYAVQAGRSESGPPGAASSRVSWRFA